MCFFWEINVNDRILNFSPDKLGKIQNISSEPELLERVILLECEIYKAKEHVKTLKQMCYDKDEQIKHMAAEIAKLNDNSDALTVG